MTVEHAGTGGPDRDGVAGGETSPPTVERGEGAMVVDGAWTYHWAAPLKPYVHPLATPAGHVLSREAPADHPWQHALWFAIKFVDGDNFWEEIEPYGTLHHEVEPRVVPASDGTVALEGTVRWLRPDRTTVALVERRRLTHVPLDRDAYAIDLDTTLVADAPCRLDRTPFTTWGGYGGLTLRGAGDWTDTTLMLDDGSTHDVVHGTASRWCDLTGRPPGAPEGTAAGVAILDHPGNRRHPSPYYGSTRAATYGDDGWSNFLNPAFLWHEPLDLEAGEELRVRHRVIVHDGIWGRDRLEAAWSAQP